MKYKIDGDNVRFETQDDYEDMTITEAFNFASKLIDDIVDREVENGETKTSKS